MIRSILLAAAAIAVPAQAFQQEDWAALTQADVDAAYAIVSETHPGAHPDIGDTVFRQVLDKAYHAALERSAQTKDEAGYRATMRGFSTALGDPHFFVAFKAFRDPLSWPSFLVRYGNGAFVVSSVDAAMSDVAIGDRLIQCDGVDALEFGQARLGTFRAVWPMPAERMREGSLLFMDDGNPFLKRPENCQFVRPNGATYSVSLRWSAIEPQRMSDLYEADRMRFGVAESGLRVANGVAWIGMPAMDASADAVTKAVASRASELSLAKAVIIDLRGNGGGDSRKGDQLTSALFGRQAIARARSVNSSGRGGAHWRATVRVADTLDRIAEGRANDYGPESEEAKLWRATANEVRAAAGQGQAFWPAVTSPVTKGAEPKRKAIATPLAEARRVFVITDAACVSSCLLHVAQLRALGVRQLGWETRASSRYMEVAFFDLPSGKARMSSLQKVNLGSPYWIGPFMPDIAAPALLDSPQSFELWARDTAVSHAEP